MPEFDPRRAHPRQVFGYTDAEGHQREIRADGNGMVRPQTAQDVAVLDSFDLPHARVTTSTSAKVAAAKTKKPSRRPAAVVETPTGELDTKGPGADREEG